MGRRCGYLEKNLKIICNHHDRLDVKKDSEIEVDDILIGKYLSGEATPQEAIILDNWRSGSPENQRRFDEASRIWDNTGSMISYSSPQLEKGWDSINAAFESSKHAFRGWKIAAAVIIIIASATFGYSFWGGFSKPAFVSFINSREQTATDTLPDHSIATVIQGTELEISKEFGKGTREVRLKGREGYFVVKRSSGDPFVIHVNDVKLTILGTAFDVNNGPAMVTVAVTEGKVKMEANDQIIMVTGGSTATYFKRTRELHLYRDSLDENIYSYATGALAFDNMSLAEVKKILEKTYRVQVHFQDSSLENLKINTRFYRQSLEYVLKVISVSLNIQYGIEGRNVYFFDERIQ